MRRWGRPDDIAWDRAVDYYLAQFAEFSDIQDARPLPLHALERSTLRSGSRVSGVS
jgi:hypothetical protein